MTLCLDAANGFNSPPPISTSNCTTLRIHVTSRALRHFSSKTMYLGYACLFLCSEISVGMEYYRAVLSMQTSFIHRKLCSGEMASKGEDYEVRIWLDMPKRGCHLSALISSLFTPLHFFRNQISVRHGPSSFSSCQACYWPVILHKDYKGWGKCTYPFTKMFEHPCSL